MQKLIFSLALAAVTLAVFAGLRQADFVWSDPKAILAEPSSDPAIAEATKAWRLTTGERFEPMTATVWAAAKATPSGRAGKPRTFHSISVGVHIVSAVLVFLILALVTQSQGASFIGALLFATHPLQVEPVAYLSAFKFVLAGAFSLFAIWQYLVYAAPSKDTRSRGNPLRHVYLATISFALAVLSTPLAVATPFVAMILGRLLPRRNSLLAGRTPMWPLVAWMVMGLFPAAWAISAQNTQALATEVPLWARPFVATDALSFYLSKIFAPVRIGPDYGRSPSYLMANWWGYVTWILPAMLFLVLSYWRNKAREWYWAAATVLAVALLPVLGLVLFENQATSTVSNPYVYLAMLGPALAVAYTVAMPRRSWLAAVSVVAVLGFAFMSRMNIKHWLTDEALWSHAVQVNPTSPIAHATLGDSFRRQGDWEKAAEHYRKVLEVNAVSPEIHFYLGEIEREHGDVKAAVELYQKTIALDPAYAPAYGRLGLAYLEEGENDAAMTHFQKSVELSPDSEEPLRFLGMLHVKKGAHAEAIPYLNRALRMDDGQVPAVRAEILALLGVAMLNTNQPDVAQEHLETALSLDPKNDSAHRTLGDIYFAQGKFAAARPHYEHALQTLTKDPALYMNLGTVLADNKQHDKAAPLFAKALELKPDWSEALNKIGISYFRLRQFDEAEASFNKASELDPSLADPHFFRGDIARWRGKKAEALAEYYQALKLDPNHLDANYRLGHHFMRENQPDVAIRHFQAALKTAPEDQRLIYSIKQAESAKTGETL